MEHFCDPSKFSQVETNKCPVDKYAVGMAISEIE
jgi:hypothetical protein